MRILFYWIESLKFLNLFLIIWKDLELFAICPSGDVIRTSVLAKKLQTCSHSSRLRKIILPTQSAPAIIFCQDQAPITCNMPLSRALWRLILAFCLRIHLRNYLLISLFTYVYMNCLQNNAEAWTDQNWSPDRLYYVIGIT